MTRFRYSSKFVLTLVVSILLHSVLGAGEDPDIRGRNAPKSRGSKFALAFMNNQARTPANTQQKITLFITTEQESSRFTLETRWSGVNSERFTETSPGSGLWSRTEIARRGEFTFINLPAGANGDQDIAVQDNGDDNIADRQKGMLITSDNENDELTVYVLSDELVSSDAYMAINCVEFSSARDYKYFIFSSDVHDGETMQSRFLFTPCQDDTTVSVRPSQVMIHPNWVESSVSNTLARNQASYGRQFNRFDTVMLSHIDDLTGTIITSNKPLSVIAGHQCGTPTGNGTCDYLVEQLPPHPTYGDLFFMAPFAVRQSGELYRIGSVTAGAQVTINCQCVASSADGDNRVELVSSGDNVYTATVGVGQYVECRTPENAQTYCCITSTHPVTVVGYTLGNRIDNLQNIVNPPLPFNPIADPAMVYIPPANSYLNSYSFSTAENLTTEFQGFLSYILLSQIFDNSEADQQRFRINGETYIPEYEAINCRVGGTAQVCAYGATKFIGQGNFDISYDNIGTGAFWGFAYGYAREVSFAYPLAFEMEPIGLAWIQAVDQVVLESVGIVDLEFSVTRGDRSVRSRAYSVTQDLSAEAGSDYTTTGLRPGDGNSNLRWRRNAKFPNNQFTVSIKVDNISEPVEVVEVIVACDGNENCYLPRTRYSITIIDDEGACADLPAFLNGSISYDYRIFTEIGGRPYGTVAMYKCDDERLVIEPTRTCVNGEWTGYEQSPCSQEVEVMFSVTVFSFGESDRQGFVEIVANMTPSHSFDFVVTGSPNTQEFVVTSAGGFPGQFTFPANQTSVRVPFNITNDEVGLEDLESNLASLSLTAGAIAAGASLGALTQATVQIMDDDGDVSRQCSGSISEGGMWKDELDLSRCETTTSVISRELCKIALDLELSSNSTTQASNQIANITSRPQNLTASQITLVTAILEQVAEEATVNQEVGDNYLRTISNIQHVDADVIYESQLVTNSSTRILASLETFQDNLNISTVSRNSTNNQTVLSFETFAVTVQDVDPDSFQGQTFVVDVGPVDEEMNNTGVINQDALVTVNGGNGDTTDNTGSPNEDAENSTAYLHLNPSFFEDCPTKNRTSLRQRLSYSVFLSDVLFLPENRSTNQVGSIVVAARLACLQTNKSVLTVPVRTSFLIRMTDNVNNSSCAVYRTQDRFGSWDTAGCREITSSNGRKDCECRQLGHFGILFDLNPTSLPENLAIPVSAITYIGLGVSVICLLVFIFTIFISKKLLADKQNQILINMSISLLCLYVTFLIGGFTVGVPPLCGVMSALLQYFFLVFFSWMVVEAVWLYVKLVVVMGSESLTSKFMLKAGLPAWLLPFVIVAISTGAGYHYYSNPYYCRPTEWPFYFGFILPFVIIYLLNWIVFVAIMVSICKHYANSNLSQLKESSRRQQFRNFKKNLIIAMCLSVVLGLGWGLGLLSTSSGLVELSFTFQVIFSIFMGSQGVLIFFFYGLRSSDFRQTWTELSNGCKSNTDSFVSFEKGITNPREICRTAGVSMKTLPNKRQCSPHNEEKELEEPKLNL